MKKIAILALVLLSACASFQEIVNPWREDPVRKVLALTNEQWVGVMTDAIREHECASPSPEPICADLRTWHERVKAAHDAARSAYIVDQRSDDTLQEVMGQTGVVIGALADLAALDPARARYYGAAQVFLLNLLRTLPALAEPPPGPMITSGGES